MKLSTSPNPLDRAISRDDSSLSVSSVNTDISMPESPVSEEKRKSLKLKKRRIVSSASSIRSAKQGFQQRNRIPSFTTSSAPPSHIVNVSPTPASQSVTVDDTMAPQTEKNNTSAPTSPAKSSSNLPSQSAVTTTALSTSVDPSITSTTPGVTAVAATSNLTNPTEIGQNTLSFPALALSITLYVPQNETQIGFQTNTYIRIIGISGSEYYEVEMNGVKGQIPVSSVILLSRQATPDWDDRLKTCDSNEGTSRLIFFKKQNEEISRSRTSTMESNDMDLSSITSPELVEINGQIWKQHQAETGQLYYFNTSDKTQCILTLPTHYLIVNQKTGKKFDPWGDVGDVLASIPEEKESGAKPMENKATKSEGNEKTEEGKENAIKLAVPEEVPTHPGWKKFTNQNGESYFLHEESHRVSFHVLPE
ncbi:hypothetical protein BKA69DRAFT_453988 [Paraphysoderma sedebokerense]|nr:hypothetical protein BKA69DRAFT_453988 [Paraphysoderma sedebokerense]